VGARPQVAPTQDFVFLNSKVSRFLHWRLIAVVHSQNYECVMQVTKGALISLPTRKLSYRKDDRAMHPMYGRRENFWESHGYTFPEIVNGLLFR